MSNEQYRFRRYNYIVENSEQRQSKVRRASSLFSSKQILYHMLCFKLVHIHKFSWCYEQLFTHHNQMRFPNNCLTYIVLIFSSIGVKWYYFSVIESDTWKLSAHLEWVLHWFNYLISNCLWMTIKSSSI